MIYSSPKEFYMNFTYEGFYYFIVEVDICNLISWISELNEIDFEYILTFNIFIKLINQLIITCGI